MLVSNTPPQLVKVGGPAIPKATISPEAQALLQQLQRIKTQINKQQSKKDAILMERPILQPVERLPQPNLHKTLIYFPNSPIPEQMEEYFDSPQQKNFTESRTVSTFHSEDTSMNIYRCKEDEDLTLHQEDLRQLQQTLYERISQLKQALQQKENNKENNFRGNVVQNRQSNSTNNSTNKKSAQFVQWSVGSSPSGSRINSAKSNKPHKVINLTKCKTQRTTKKSK